MKKKILVAIILLVISLFVILGIFLTNKDRKQNAEIVPEESISSKIERVKSATAFYTVENCVNKYLVYLSERNTNIIFNLLDENYKKELNITEQNVLQHVENINGNYTFSAKDMYYETNGDIQKYYVTGELVQDALPDVLTGENIEFNITVILDMKNSIFSIIPYGYGGMYYEN